MPEVIAVHYDILKKELKDKKYRMTPQREQVLKVFLEVDANHLGSEEVYKYLIQKRINISKATVFRTLDLLAELGFLRKLNFGNEIFRYELAEKEKGQNQFICSECGSIIELKEVISPTKFVKEYIEHLASKGYEISNIDFKIHGVCPSCAKKAKKAIIKMEKV